MVYKNIVVRIEISQISINSSQETTRDGIWNWKIATKATQAFCFYQLKQIRGLIIWEKVKNSFNTHTDNTTTLNKCYMYLNFNPIKIFLESFNFFFLMLILSWEGRNIFKSYKSIFQSSLKEDMEHALD